MLLLYMSFMRVHKTVACVYVLCACVLDAVRVIEFWICDDITTQFLLSKSLMVPFPTQKDVVSQQKKVDTEKMCAVIKPLRWSALVTYFCCEGGLPSRDSALSCMSALKILGTHQKSHSPDSFATMLLCQFSAEIVQKLQMALNISSAEVTFHTDSSVNVDISLLRQDPETPIPISHDENHIVIHDIWFNLPATFKQQQTVLKLLLKTISSLPTNKAAATERAPKRRKLAKVHSAA